MLNLCALSKKKRRRKSFEVIGRDQSNSCSKIKILKGNRKEHLRRKWKYILPVWLSRSLRWMWFQCQTGISATEVGRFNSRLFQIVFSQESGVLSVVQDLQQWEKRQDIVEVQALYEAGKYVQSSKQWMKWKPQKRSCRKISKLSSYQWQRPSQAKKCSKKTTLHPHRKSKRTRHCCRSLNFWPTSSPWRQLQR